MKKLIVPPLLFLAVALSYCTSSKQTSTSTSSPSATPTVTYLADIKPIVTNNCSPCHIPPQGSKKPLDTYADVKSEIKDIIERIKLNPGDKGFMPARHPKLPDATIQKFITWQNEGMAEK